MKQQTLKVVGWILFTLFSKFIHAQKNIDSSIQSGDNNKETQEIIIRKNGGKNTKITLEIMGGKILINGKPMAEFNEDGLTINNRKMIIRNGKKITLDFDTDDMLNFNDPSHLKDINIDNLNNEFWGNGSSSRTFLGVVTDRNKDGVRIISIEKNSPAEKAGLEKDDIIYKIDDTDIKDFSSLKNTISKKKDGDKVKIFYKRNEKKKNTEAVLENRKMDFKLNGKIKKRIDDDFKFYFKMPKTPTVPEFDIPNYDVYGSPTDELFFGNKKSKVGIKIQDTENEEGVKVLEIEEGSAAWSAGLKVKDIIIEIGNEKIKNTDEARRELSKNVFKKSYTIKADRDGKLMEFTIKIIRQLKTIEL